SLTITALTERAMSFIPPKENQKPKFFEFEKKWNILSVLYKDSVKVNSIEVPKLITKEKEIITEESKQVKTNSKNEKSKKKFSKKKVTKTKK
ncbi:MAG: hypothetical protein N3A69_10595, partial [Leptospiraceae bacterium]|nr:hypothetical protein [Leptospiraceae bacterium]